jgi:acyl phosphate:glycerol-3-phosphate acyltransferase
MRKMDMFMPVPASPLYAILFAALGYICGSLPFSIWITRYVKGVDVREAGSHHATTTNTIRQAGFGWGALVLTLDIAKGFVPTYLAVSRDDIPTYIIALTAACAVIGHCWPIFAQFRGGMGLACAGGCILAVDLVASLIGLAILIALVLIIHHGARASVVTGLVLAPVYYLIGRGEQIIWLTAGVGVVIAFRFLIDWNRRYRELWLDRDKT